MSKVGTALQAFERALRRESHTVKQRPDQLWQQLYNRLQWSGEAAEIVEPERARRSEGGAAPWLRSRAPFRESDPLIRVLAGHTGGVFRCNIRPDERLVASASADGTAGIWDTETGRVRVTLQTSAAEFWCCAFSPDGSRLAAGDTSGGLTIWESETGSELVSLGGASGPVTSCAFSPDGSRLVAGGWDGLKLFDADGWGEIFALEGTVSACAFSPDGSQITSGGFDDLQVRDAGSGETLRKLTPAGTYSNQRISSCPFSPDGSVVASTDRYHEGLHLWNAATGELKATLVHNAPIWGCCWSPDGRFVLAALNDGTVRISDVATEQTRATLHGHAGTVFDCVVSSGGALVVSGSADGTVRIWNADAAFDPQPDTDRPPPPRLHRNTVLTCAVSHDGSFVVSTSRSGTVAISDEESGAERATMQERYIGGVEGCAISPDDSLFITAHYDGTVVLWDAQTGEERAAVQSIRGGIGFGVRDCAVSADGSLVVSANGNGTLKIWDADRLWREQTWSEQAELRGRHAERNDTSACFQSCSISPGCSVIVSASEDSTLVVWDIERRSELASLEGHSAPVTCCAVSPDGLLVASASMDATVKLWDTQSWRERASLRGNAAPVMCCAFSPDGLLVLSASEDGTVTLWDTETRRERAMIVFPGGVHGAAFHPRLPRVVCGGRGGDLYSVELVGIEYGPTVLTAAGSGRAPAVRCPACLERRPLDPSWLGREIACPNAGCEARMRVNPFVADYRGR